MRMEELASVPRAPRHSPAPERHSPLRSPAGATSSVSASGRPVSPGSSPSMSMHMMYAKGNDLKQQLKVKYQRFSVSELKGSAKLANDTLESDIQMTVRLQIVYGRLSIRSIHDAVEKSVGSMLQKFGEQEDTKELLQSIVSLFKDESKLAKGSVIKLRDLCTQSSLCFMICAPAGTTYVQQVEKKTLPVEIFTSCHGAQGMPDDLVSSKLPKFLLSRRAQLLGRIRAC